MSYFLFFAGLVVLILGGYLLMRPARQSETKKTDEKPNPVRDSFDVPKKDPKWAEILTAALDHIYAGQPSSIALQTHPAFFEPSPEVSEKLRTLAKAFDRVGSLHSSLAALDKPNTTMRELGDMVIRDPVLSARVLKTVNSPFFGLAKDVKSIHTAVSILGLGNLKNLVAFGSMPYDLYKTENQRQIFLKIWMYMNYSAITASAFSKNYTDIEGGVLYTAGLMHDLGKLILLLLLDGTEDFPATMLDEYSRFSATHVHATRVLSETEGIPEELKTIVRMHHLPAVLPVNQLDCNAKQAKSITILFLANQIAKLITLEGELSGELEGLEQLDPSYREILPKEDAARFLLDSGLLENILDSARAVRSMLA